MDSKFYNRKLNMREIFNMYFYIFLRLLKSWIIVSSFSNTLLDHDMAVALESEYLVLNTSGHQYLLSNTISKSNITGAHAYCTKWNAELTLFENNKEFNEVFNLAFNGIPNEVWTQMNRTDANNDMVYEHNWRSEPVNQSAWISGQPADCGRMVNATVPCCPAMIKTPAGLAYRKCSESLYFVCSPNNECLDGTANCSQICVDNANGFVCSCRAGYILAADGSSCNDVDECKAKKSPCPQVCVNTDGSYNCKCFEGYAPTGVNGTCVDVDECVLNPCEHECANRNGSFVCSCRSGYTLSRDNVSCVDIDECANHTLHPCQQNCVNTNGSYLCRCEIGLTLSPNGRNCTDVDECLDRPCQNMCNNTYGSFTCFWTDGYALTNSSLAYCNASQDTCGEICVGTDGSLACPCGSGYSPRVDSLACVDVDECATNISNCTGPCTNTDGGYFCGCPDGYKPNQNDYCVDIDECADRIDNCSHHCDNTIGGYICTCNEGYRLRSDQSTCVDIDECKEGLHACDHGCINAEGFYNCTCNSGYILDPADRTTCHDIDECNTTIKLCDHHCNNIQGSFYCSCQKGFALSGKYCIVRKLTNYCPCSCLYLNQHKLFTVEYARKQLAQLKQQLGIVNSNLTSYKMLKSCQDDPRSSAESMGIGGGAFIIAVLGVVIIPDVLFVMGWIIAQMKNRHRRSIHCQM